MSGAVTPVDLGDRHQETGEFLEDEHGSEMFDTVLRRVEEERLREALNSLFERGQRVLMRRYGLDDREDHLGRAGRGTQRHPGTNETDPAASGGDAETLISNFGAPGTGRA